MNRVGATMFPVRAGMHAYALLRITLTLPALRATFPLPMGKGRAGEAREGGG